MILIRNASLSFMSVQEVSLALSMQKRRLSWCNLWKSAEPKFIFMQAIFLPVCFLISWLVFPLSFCCSEYRCFSLVLLSSPCWCSCFCWIFLWCSACYRCDTEILKLIPYTNEEWYDEIAWLNWNRQRQFSLKWNIAIIKHEFYVKLHKLSCHTGWCKDCVLIS